MHCKTSVIDVLYTEFHHTMSKVFMCIHKVAVKLN